MNHKKRKSVEANTSSTSGNSLERIDLDSYRWIQKVKSCPVYHPTIEEYEDPLTYIHSIAEEASQYGICKIVPPLETYMPSSVYLEPPRDIKLQTVVQPLLADMNNGAAITYSKGRVWSLGEFYEMATKASLKWLTGEGRVAALRVEVEFWEELLNRQDKQVLSGINMDRTPFGSSFSDSLATSKWSFKMLPKLPNSVLRHMDTDAIQGVTYPTIHVGMLYGMFAWHMKENYLYSISFNHLGEPKMWYGVPGSKAELFEEVVEKHIFNSHFPSVRGNNAAANMLSKRSSMFCPSVLLPHGVPVFKTLQWPGELVITFPKVYHAGFNHGFNFCETINFATTNWLSFGASRCLNYAQIETSHIIPYEELVYKEAMLLWNNSCNRELSSLQRESAIAFTILVRTHHLIRWCLWKLKGKSLTIVPKNGDIINCGQCHRNCYISYMTCKQFPSPTCMFHEVEDEYLKIFVHEDILAIEAKAKVLEEKNEVKEKVMDHICWMGKSDLFRWMLSALLKGGYHPYCPIKEISWINEETKPSTNTCVVSNNCNIKKESLELSTNSQIKKEMYLRSGRIVSNNCKIKKENS